ncbi:MAG: endonuclease/exonuclease/phosphatase family protein [Paludibacteraceae bacterium]|nr:endonuclease/exonuclease/phosphatase family protein [Paludibacteraceae bacterium]
MAKHKKHKGCLRRLLLWLIPLALIASLPLIAHNPFHHRREGKDFDRKISIMTYNTHRMGMFHKTADNPVLTFLMSQDVDIVCLQEVEVYHDSHYLTLDELRRAMSKWPYTYFDFKIYNSRRQFGNVVFSRYPLIDKHTVPFTSRASISSCCDVVVDNDTLRLIVNQLESNRLEAEDMPLDSLRTDPKYVWYRVKGKMGKAEPIRRKQADAVRQEIKDSPYPVVVAGDFNALPYSYTYRHIKHGLRDSFLETQFLRMGWTYVRHHLGVRIDYILCSRSLTPISSQVIHTSASDHYPYISTIAWPIPDAE